MVVTPPGEGLTSFALSPDGRHVVFQATTAGKTQLWLRPLASDTPQPMQGTDGGTFPFWSPDSRSIGFFADQRLKRIDVDGRIAQELAEARYAVGGTWNRDGVILFGPSTTGPLYRVPAQGGKAMEVTQVNPPLQTSHRFPFFLPDGRHFLFFIAGTEGQGLYAGSLDPGEPPKQLFSDVVMAVFAPPDNLVFLRQGRLFQQRFDVGTLTLLGNAVSIAANVVSTSSSRLLAEGAISASETGLLAYRASVTEPRQLLWFDRSGKQTGALGDKDVAGGALRLSPDGQTVALERSVNRQSDLWLMETARGVLTRFTTDGANNGNPVWSPDGKQVAFVSRRSGRQSIYVGKAAGAVLSEKALIETSENNIPEDWSADGRLILYERENSATGLDLWTVDLKTGMSSPAVEQTSYNEADGRFSPNGQWIVYQSNESGRPEIYVTSFPPGQAGKKQISTEGGLSPQWNRNGREVVYMGLDDRLMSAGIALQANGSRVEVQVPKALFANRPGSQFDVASDGEHFLVNTFIQDVTTPPITVILNWGK
jgi:Tol biopolymer transport system component